MNKNMKSETLAIFDNVVDFSKTFSSPAGFVASINMAGGRIDNYFGNAIWGLGREIRTIRYIAKEINEYTFFELCPEVYHHRFSNYCIYSFHSIAGNDVVCINFPSSESGIHLMFLTFTEDADCEFHYSEVRVSLSGEVSYSDAVCLPWAWFVFNLVDAISEHPEHFQMTNPCLRRKRGKAKFSKKSVNAGNYVKYIHLLKPLPKYESPATGVSHHWNYDLLEKKTVQVKGHTRVYKNWRGSGEDHVVHVGGFKSRRYKRKDDMTVMVMP